MPGTDVDLLTGRATVVAAPMAGGASGPRLAIAVAEAGALHDVRLVELPPRAPAVPRAAPSL